MVSGPLRRPGFGTLDTEGPRFLTSPTRDYVHYGWWKSADNGSAVTELRAARRCLRNGVVRGLGLRDGGPGSVYYTNFRGLAGLTACQDEGAGGEPGGQQWLVARSARISKQA